MSWKNQSEPRRAEGSTLHDEMANWGHKQKKEWEREWGLNLTHAIPLTQGLSWGECELCFVCVCAAMLDEDEEDRVDEIALRQLTEMGFPESRAVKALRLNQ